MQATLRILRTTPLLATSLKRPFSQTVSSPLLVANPILNAMPDFFAILSNSEKHKASEKDEQNMKNLYEIHDSILKADLQNLSALKGPTSMEIKDCISNILNNKASNYTPEETRKISAGLCRQYAHVLVESGAKLELSVLKNLLYMTKDSLLSPIELFYALYKIARGNNTMKKLNIEEILSVTFFMHELFRTPRLKRTSSSEKEKLFFIIGRLQQNLEVLLDESIMNESDKLFFLPKIYFCNVILGNQDTNFLNKVIGRIYSCDFIKLEDKDLLNLFYITISTEKKVRLLPNGSKLYENHMGLFNRIETIINNRINDENLNHSSIPFLLFCYSLTPRTSGKVTYILMKKAVDNIQKFNPTEISTILYSMFRMPELDPNNDILVLVLSMFYNRENLQTLNGMNLFATLLGIRKPYQETTNPKHKELFKSFILRIQKRFEENFDQMEKDSKLRIIYEFVHIHKLVTKENYIEHYRKYLETIELGKLNTQDLLTIGSIQRKFITFDQESYEFWENYLSHLTKVKFESEAEAKRAFSIVKNIMSILDFDMLVNQNGQMDAKNRTQWYDMIHSHYKKLSIN